MKLLGYLFLVAGLLGMAAAFFFPIAHTTLEVSGGLGSIANLNLLAQRSMLHMTAGTLALIGSVLLGASYVAHSLNPPKARPLPAEQDYAEIDAIWSGRKRG
ncbi:hypothetical protein [Microvirga makkahensis]|uniref:Uncharacterized protein n=1 Tax=Microvirga makkahensis TaxID=1128670 RepID=A0A7X3MQ79_9HYPH|nr:hypothetical protein [Microvirga makkahensis]MXQ11189.1 hypothetical protein [Microvirga makkahensis]